MTKDGDRKVEGKIVECRAMKRVCLDTFGQEEVGVFVEKGMK